jgi:hypothetical protein
MRGLPIFVDVSRRNGWPLLLLPPLPILREDFLMTIGRIFARFRGTQKRSSRRHSASGGQRQDRLALQRLEDRLALAFTVEPVALTTSPATFAYNVYIDDQVNGAGDGRDIFIQHSTDGNPYFLIADNAAFNNARRLSTLLASLGECTTLFATTAARQGGSTLLATPNAFASTYTFTLPSPNPVTLSGTLSLDQWQELATVDPASADSASGVRSGNTITNITGANLSNVVKDTIVYAPGFLPPLTKVVSVGAGSVTLDKPVFGAGAFPFTFYSPTALFYGEASNSTTVQASSTFGANNGDILLGASIPNNTTTVSGITPTGFTTNTPVTITPTVVTFDYDSDGTLPFAGGPLTVSAASTPAWAAAGYGVPTADVVGSTLTFSFWKTGTPPTVPKLLDGAPFAPPVIASHGAYSYYTTSITNPQSFTAFASARIPDQRLIVDLQPVGSRISIATPWKATKGSTSDPVFYNSYGGYITSGQAALFASEITVSSELTSSSRINFAPSALRYSGYSTPLTSLVVDDRLIADDITANLRGAIGNPASMVITPAGAVDASGSFTVTADFANIRAEGQVNAATQTYYLKAVGSNEQYVFTTRAASTGVNTGVIRGTSVGITMGQPAGGTVDLRTDLQTLRFQSGTTNDAVPYRYAVTIDETNDLTVDAVASSSGPIAIRAGNNLTIKGNAVRTADDLTFEAVGALAIQGSVATANGNVRLAANALNLTSTVNAGGSRNVSLQSSTGATSINALAQAGGGIKQSVRVATTGNITLSGTPTIDGVAILAGDRVLVKNQSTPTQNGIYVAASGTWSRATDANTSALLVPGFAVFATEGTQRGGWVFLNPVNPILTQSGLAFVPMTASRVFDEADAATTAATGNITLSGTPTIDGVTLTAGQRVLVTNQTNPAENGIYVVAAGPWSRASDADAANEMIAGAYVFVRGGTTNGGQGFALTGDAVMVGTSPLTFDPFTIQPTRTNTWSPANALGQVKVATTAPIALSGLQTIDGVLLQANDRVLVKHQLNPTENGVYVAATGSWTRALDADTSAELARGTAVYVSSGTLNAGTAWDFDDSIRKTGDVAVNSTTISNLSSTADLSVGMLVVGRGIPANTTIAGLGGDGKSIRLSVPATATRLLSPLTFVGVGTIPVGATPIVFIPAGGDADVMAATSITTSNALIDASTALLTAGTLAGASQAASLINTRTSVGRVTATAPAAITLVDNSAIGLADVRSTTAGAISVTATSMIAASSVTAKGTTAVAGNITLLSSSSDIVAGTVTTDRGAISLTSTVGSIYLPSAPLAANVSSGNGSVMISADKGAIDIDGRINAQGTGSDVTLSSNDGSLTLRANAAIAADDQFKIFLPNNSVTVAPGMQSPAATRLSITSQFGASNAPPTSLGTYSVVELNRTDAGDIIFSSPTALTVEGASTVSGSIAFTAPTITVSGGISPTGANTDISLTASAGDLIIGSPVASQRDITLSAAAGKISNAAGNGTALLTAPRNVIATAAGLASLNTKAAAFQATLTGRNATLLVSESDDLTISSATLSGGGTATFNVGSATAGGALTIANGGSINVTSAGTVNVTAYGNIAATRDANADIVAATATLASTTGNIGVDTDVDTLIVSSGQRNSVIDVDDVAVRTTPHIAVSTGAGNDGNVDITSPRTILAGAIATTGNVSIQATGTSADIVVSNISSANGIVSLSAGKSILEATPTDPSAEITATSVRLLATTGSIDAHLNTVNIAAEANSVNQTLSIRNDGPLSVGAVLGTNGITGRAVTITTGVAGGPGAVSQTQPITATSSLTIINAGNAGDVTLLSTANSTPTLAIANAGRNVSYRNAVALDISSAGIQAATVALTVAGSLTDTGAITATSSLSVTGNGNAITLDNAANDTPLLTIANAGGAVTYRDASGFDVGTAGIQGTAVALTAAGSITDTGSIVATSSLAVTGNGSAITLDNTANDTPSLTIANAGGAVTYRDASGFDVGTAGIQGTAVALTAAGSITDTGSIVATSSLAVTGNGTAITLDNAANDTPSLTIANAGGAVAYRDASGFDVGTAGIRGTAVSIRAAGSITDTGSIVATSSLAVTGNGSAITLDNAANDTPSLTIANAGGAVAYRDASGFDVGTAGIQGTAVVLTAVGPLTDTGALSATTSLDAVVTGPGAIVLNTATNTVALFRASTAAGDVIFVNGSTFSTGLVTAGTSPVGDGNISLKAGAGNIVVTGDLSAPNDKITLEARAGTFTLSNGVALAAGSLVYYVATTPNLGTGTTLPAVMAPNGVWTISGGALSVSAFPLSAFDGDISISGSTLNVDRSLQAIGANRKITIATTNGVTTNGGSLLATELVVTNGGGAVTLNGNNNFDAVSIANAGRPVTYSDADGFGIGSAGIQGSTVAINAGGTLTQIGSIAASSLAVSLSSGIVNVGNAGNDVGSLSISNPGRSAIYRDSNALTIAGIQAGDFSLTAGGNVTQTGSAAVSTLSATTPGSLTLTATGNSIPAINQVIAGGDVTIATSGNLSIGPAAIPTALLKSATRINLAGVAGNVILENGGRIEAPSIVLGTGDSIVISVGGSASATALSNAIVSANSMPGVPTTISLAAGSTVSLTEALPPIDSPIVMVGNGATIRNAGAVAVGLLLLDGAVGSQISGLTFQGFTSAGVALDGTRNATISGVSFVGNAAGLAAQGDLAGTRVTGSRFTNNTVGVVLQDARGLVFGGIGTAGNLIESASRTSTGLLISGTSTGTRVIGNRFNGHAQAIQLTSATGVTVGGRARGEGNTISGAARAGVFASGFCTRSQVIKTVFTRTPRTPTQFNVRSARGLRVVK